MDRKTFAILLKRYLDGEASEKERLTVEQWYALLDEVPTWCQTKDWDLLESKLWARLEYRAGLGSGEEDTAPTRSFFRSHFSYLVAASITLILLAGYVFWARQSDMVGADLGYKVVSNRDSQMLDVLLEDGSMVTLSPKATLRHPEKFDIDFREVFLEGEAFFKISENPDRPFYVNAGKITTKVLGTSFTVKAPTNGSDVEVSVKSGKVSVYEKEKHHLKEGSKANNGVILKPNQQVTFMGDRSAFVTQLVEVPLPVNEQDPAQFQFDDKPLKDVLQLLEYTYAIDITLDRRSLGGCPLTANLYHKGLYAQLDLICAAIQGKYELKGTTILISGCGCE